MKTCLLVGLLHLWLKTALSQPILEKLVNRDFLGQYAHTQNTSLFDYLTVQSGSIDLVFLNHRNDSLYQTSQPNSIELELFNPKYHDGRSVTVCFDLGIFNQTDGSWVGNNTEMGVEFFNKGNFQRKEICQGDFRLVLDSINSNTSPQNIKVTVVVVSKDADGKCGFALSAQLKQFNDQKFVVLYAGFSSLVMVMQLLSSFKLIQKHDHGQLIANKISLSTATVCTIQDFYLMMVHVYFIMLERYYMYIILPIFLMVVQSMFFDMKLIFIVWRASFMHIAMTTSQLRKRLTLFYVKFYLSLFFYLSLMYFFHFDWWALMLQPFLIFLPQIIKNVKKGSNSHFYKSYVLGVLGLRSVLVFYYKGCPDNIYKMTPSLTFCVCWGLSFAVLIVFLLLQHRLGSRFFVPKRCIPGYYDYSFMYVPESIEEIPQCSICLQLISVDREEEMVINTSILQSFIGKGKSVEVMKTPCSHLFHKGCLKDWMDFKLGCPTCRSPIPPLIQ